MTILSVILLINLCLHTLTFVSQAIAEKQAGDRSSATFGL